MATKIHRYAFNVGLLSPDLWYRPELARYHQGLRVADNWLIKPHGPAYRRPGTQVERKLINALDTATHGAVFEFQVDRDTYYWIVIYPYAAASQLQIISQLGAVLHTQDTNYLPNELEAIQVKQSYDIMYIQHPNHDPMELIRTSPTTWVWQIKDFFGGPIGFINTNRSFLMSLAAKQWDATVTFAEGDKVVVGVADTFTATTGKELSHSYISHKQIIDEYLVTVQPTAGTGAFQKNDLIEISGTGTGLDGQWPVVKKDTALLYLRTGTAFNTQTGIWVNDFSGITGGGDITVTGNKQQIFQSLQAANLNNDPTVSPTWWKEVDNLNGANNVYASEDYFTAAMVGKLLRFNIDLNLTDQGNFGTGDTDAVSKEIPCNGTVQLTTEGGSWEGKLSLEKTFDNGQTWEEIAVISSEDGNKNGTVVREVSDFGALVRCRMRERSAATTDTGCIWYLEVIGSQYTYAEIETYVNAKLVTVQFQSAAPRYSTTWKWALGAMGGDDGFPGALDFFEERMVIAGIPGYPGVVFGSEIDKWDTWQEGTLATSPFKFTLRGGARNDIYWLIPMAKLVIGTDNSEHTLGSRDRDEAMNGGNRSAEKRADFGCAPVNAISSGDRVFYVEAGGKNIRSMSYYWEKEGWDSDDIMGICRHLLKDDPVTSMAFQRAPYSTLWCRRADGKLLTFTFSYKEEVAAWTIQDVGGDVLDIATASVTGGYDIACLVKRDNGLYLETISPENDCRDFSTTMQNTHAPTYDLLCLDNEPGLLVEDGIGLPVTDPLLGQGQFIRIINPITDLVIKEDGAQLTAGSDYVVTESGLIWIPTASGTITVFDALVLQVDGVDYEIADSTTYHLINIYNDDVDLSTAVVWYDTSIMLPGVTRFDQGDPRQIIVDQASIDPTSWKMFDGARLMDRSEYDPVPITAVFCAANFEYNDTVLIGQQMTSELSPTDLAASPEQGGPGGHVRSTMAELYLNDSMGGEVSTDEGKTWQPINYVENNTVPGVKLPLWSGKKEVTLGDGWQTDGALVRIRNTGSQKMTIAAIGLNAARNKGRQA